MATRRRGRKVDGDVEDAIREKASLGWAPAQIDRWLWSNPGFKDRDLPEPRTTQRIVADQASHDPSGPWGIGDAGRGDAAPILGVLGAVILASEGRKSAFTKREASWVLQVRQAAPTLSPVGVYQVAYEYILREDRKQGSPDLDAFLCLRPWESQEAANTYWDAVDKGWITAPRGLLFNLVAEERAAHYRQAHPPPTPEQMRMARRLRQDQEAREEEL